MLKTRHDSTKLSQNLWRNPIPSNHSHLPVLNCIVRLICEVQTVDITLILPPFHPIWYLGLIFGAVIKYFATCFWHLSTSPTRDLESFLQLRLFLQEFLVHSTDKHWNPSGTPQQKPAWNIDLLSINWQIMRKWGFPLLVQAADDFFLLYPLLQASSKSKQMMIPKLPGNETPVGCLFSGRDEYRTGRWCDSVDSTCCWWKRSCT